MHRTEGTYNDENLFTDGPPGTRVEKNWLNAVQEEIATVIENSGLTLKTSSTETSNQLAAAIILLAAANTNIINDITPQLGGTLDTNGFAINGSYATVASHATTSAIWTAGGNIINFTGSETITDFPEAPRAGSERKLICTGATTFTNAGNISVQGATNFTASAGDIITVKAITTTTFRITIEKADGTSIIASSGPITSAIYGLTLSNDTDTDHDILVSIGSAFAEDDNSKQIVLSTEMTKRIDAAWAVGDNAGGMATGTVANSTWYGVFVIRKDSDASVDVMFDISPIAANIPAGYTNYRRIGWVLTDGSANILNFTDIEIAGGSVKREWNAMINDYPTNDFNTLIAITTSCPINSIGSFAISATANGTAANAWFASSSLTDVNPATRPQIITSAATTVGSFTIEIPVDASNQIAARSTGGALFVIWTMGYIDRRVS